MTDINGTLEPGSLRSGVQGEWSDTTRSISPCTHISQIIQNARISFQSSELDPSISSPAREGCSSPLWTQTGETDSLEGERVGEGVPISTKGQTLWYSMYTIIPLRLKYKYITEMNFESVLCANKRTLSF